MGVEEKFTVILNIEKGVWEMKSLPRGFLRKFTRVHDGHVYDGEEVLQFMSRQADDLDMSYAAEMFEDLWLEASETFPAQGSGASRNRSCLRSASARTYVIDVADMPYFDVSNV